MQKLTKYTLLSLLFLTACYKTPSDYPTSLELEKSFMQDIYSHAEEKIQGEHAELDDIFALDRKKTLAKTLENDERLNFIKRYEVTWLGFHVGDLYVKIKSEEQGGDLFSRMQVIIRSYGLAHKISKFQSDSQSLMKYMGNGQYIPYQYATSFALRKKRRDITFLYNEDGSEILTETNVPPEKRWKRPEVEAVKKANTYDPLTLSLMARTQLIAAIADGKKEFTMNLYDGRRRTNFDFKIKERRGKEQLIHMTFTENPISGYTNNELKKIKNEKTVISLFISPKDFLPVSAEGESSLGTALIKLKDECSTLKECLNN